MTTMRKKWIYIAPLALLGLVVFAFIGGELVKHLWNWLLPPLFGWKEVTFWQALGLLALCRILFGGLGMGGPGRRGPRRHMRERWERMTPEARERAGHWMRERCGAATGPVEGPSH
jgi:hypothetical protein